MPTAPGPSGAPTDLDRAGLDPRRSRRRDPRPSSGGTVTRPATTAVTLRWLCPCAFCRGEAGLPGWLDSAPQLTRGADPPGRPPARRPVRDRPDLGRWPPHRLLHVRDAARHVPVRRVHGPTRRRGSADDRPAGPRQPQPRGGPMIIATTPYVAGYRVTETEGPGLRPGRPQPRPGRQRRRRAPVAGRRRDPRVHPAARGHPPPGDRPDGPERDPHGRQCGPLDALRLVGARRDDVRDRGLRDRRRRGRRRLGRDRSPEHAEGGVAATVTAMYGFSRSVLFGLAALSFVGGLTCSGRQWTRHAAACSSRSVGGAADHRPAVRADPLPVRRPPTGRASRSARAAASRRASSIRASRRSPRSSSTRRRAVGCGSTSTRPPATGATSPRTAPD